MSKSLEYEFFPHKEIPEEDQDDSDKLGCHNRKMKMAGQRPHNNFCPHQTKKADDHKKRKFFFKFSRAFENPGNVDGEIGADAAGIRNGSGEKIIKMQQLGQDEQDRNINQRGGSAGKKIADELMEAFVRFMDKYFVKMFYGQLFYGHNKFN